MTDIAAERTAEQWFRNYIKQFWQYLSDVEINDNEELRDEFFLSMNHGLQRSRAEMILGDMKRQFVTWPITGLPDATYQGTV